MNDIIEMILSPEVNTVGACFKLALSALLGAMVGLERKSKGQRAGIRTFALISLGATLAMLVSIYIPQIYMGLKNGDPGRIAAQVVSGVGFLGAGAIIQSKGSVRGLTTAAGIWMTAMMGVAVGAGMYLISIVAALLELFILIVLDRYEHTRHASYELKIIRLKIGALLTDLSPYLDIFKQYNITVNDKYIRYEYDNTTTTVNFRIRVGTDIEFIEIFEKMREVNDKTISITLNDEINN